MSNITVISIALLGILIFVLGANVTRHRAMRGDTGNQQPSDPADRMYIAQRAHGNAAEYVPTLIGLLIVCSVLTDGWWLDALSLAAVALRGLHALGMLTSTSLAVRSPIKEVGAMGTYAVGIALGVTAVVSL